MTPAQEEAKRLVERFKPYCDGSFYSPDVTKANAKQCAIICVEEQLELIECFDLTVIEKYLNEVKQEIEKL